MTRAYHSIALSFLALTIGATAATARPIPHPPHLSHPTAMATHTPPHPGGGGHPPGPGPGPGPSPHPPGPGPHPPGPGPGPGPGPHPPGPPPPPPPHWGWDDDFYWDHPIATGAAIGVVAGVTAAAIGSTVYSLPESCVTVFSGNLTYFQCGTVWYQPRYVGSGVTYIVVNPPG